MSQSRSIARGSRQSHRLWLLCGLYAAMLWTCPRRAQATPPPTSPVHIAEFMAANRSTLRDEDGDFSDWIEILNDGPLANLDGWILTTDPTTLAGWRLPRVSLLTGARLIVFASGKNRASPTNELHTSFRLQRESGFLALVRPDGTNIASAFAPTYPRQHDDVSFGRLRYMPEATGYFVSPTPGHENMAEGPGFAPAVVFSRAGGLFTNELQLELSSAEPAAVIRYTTNGTPPTANSTLYNGPLQFTQRIQIRARAFLDPLLPGPIRSEVFLPANPALFRFTSNLPLVVLDSFGRTIPENGDLPAFVAVFEPGPDGRTSFTNAPTLQTRVATDRRGSSTLGQPKANYNLEAWDEFNADKPIAPLGLPAESDFILHAPYNWDPSLIRNPLIYELSAQMGRYAPRYRLVEVFVNIGNTPLSTNHYAGIYNLLEKIKRDANRVDIDRLEPLDNRPDTISGGYLLKIDRLNPGDSGFNAGGATMAYVEPQEAELRTPQRAPQRAWLTARLNAFTALLNRADYTNAVTGYRPWIDAPAWIDFHLLNTLSGNVDAFRLSTFLHIPRNGPITFGPVWDFDRSLGSTDGRDVSPRAWNAGGSEFFNFPWWSRVLRDPNLWQQWVDRWQDLRLSTLSTPNVEAIIDRLNDQIAEAVPRDFTRWRQPKRGNSQAGEIRHLKNWISNRLDFIDTQFVPQPRAQTTPILSPIPIPTLTLTAAPNTTIYYTLNGTDPRAPNGAPQRHALRYTGPTPMDETAAVIARAFSATSPQRTTGGSPPARSYWSSPLRLRLSPHPGPEPGDIALNELHFHPPTPTPAELQSNSGLTDEDFEFIELRNLSDHTLDLHGLRFVEGIHAELEAVDAPALPPGGLAVFARNPVALALRHGRSTRIAGTYTGRLANQGERIKLVNRHGRTLFDFSYADAWSPPADGEGPSLALAFPPPPHTDWSVPQPWQPGKVWGGSPGYSEPEPWTPETLTEWKIRRFATAAPGLPAESNDLADPDGDGASNLDEFLAGTHPLDPTDALRVVDLELTGEGVQLRFPIAAGRSYQILTRTIADRGWSVLQTLTSVRQSELAVVLDRSVPSSPGAPRFYRLAVLPR